jgi:hypothetical protein
MAEQNEREFKAALTDAQQEAEDNAKKAAEFEEKLVQTEEAMKLAEEKAAADAAEKAAMLEALEANLALEVAAKEAAAAKAEELSTAISQLEGSIADARHREGMLRASLSLPMVQINPKAAAGLDAVGSSLQGQRSSLAAIRSLLAGGRSSFPVEELQALVASYESAVLESERAAAQLSRDLVASGDFAPSSKVGQAVADVQQTATKQRALLNSLKRMIADANGSVDRAAVAAVLADLEPLILEMEARQAALESAIKASASPADSGMEKNEALAQFERTLRDAQTQLATMKRQLAVAEAEKQAALERQAELERLSIEIRYDIDYKQHSFSYQRRYHSMFNQVANPEQER